MSEGTLRYATGFGGYFESEAVKGALPIGRNSPQRPAFGLYAEQLSGSAFTAPRRAQLRSWLYRIQPSVVHGVPVETKKLPTWLTPPFAVRTPPTQMRWNPLPMPLLPTTFLEGVTTMVGHGSPQELAGCTVHIFAFNRAMDDTYFLNSDGDLLFVPESGELEILSEFGPLHVVPGEICHLPRGVKFQVKPRGSSARGYLGENFGAPFVLPDLGPIGANGLASPRDFLYPQAQYEKKPGSFRLVNKFQGAFWDSSLDHSPLDVVAWHGNLAPWKYDLQRFNTMGSISFDHPDPSIFTVVTSPSPMAGTANVDFVIFPGRWLVAEDTFRPPYYHRNIMSEYMGLIYGVYDAKPDGFLPGGASLHNCMAPHGPDAATFHAATEHSGVAQHLEKTMAFMFESCKPWNVSPFALDGGTRQRNYLSCWDGLRATFPGGRSITTVGTE